MPGERSGSEITDRNHSLIPSLCKFVFQYDFVWDRVKTHLPVLKVSWYSFLSEFAHVYKPAVHVRKLKPLRALACVKIFCSCHKRKILVSNWNRLLQTCAYGKRRVCKVTHARFDFRDCLDSTQGCERSKEKKRKKTVRCKRQCETRNFGSLSRVNGGSIRKAWRWDEKRNQGR